jgi:hypothetical protein
MGWSHVNRARVPASCRDLKRDRVIAALTESGVNVSAAAKRLRVPTGDLRQLLYASPELLALSAEREQQRLDRAELVLDRELFSEDSRLSTAAALFVLRNHRHAAERGWRQADATVTVNTNTAVQHNVVYRWRTEADDKRDEEARLKEAEDDRHYAEQGKKVISVGWSQPASEEAPKDSSPDLFENFPSPLQIEHDPAEFAKSKDASE